MAAISRLDLPRAALAYLSACSTSRGSERLADEAVHLAGACQLAGFPQVVGTLWEVGDRTSGRVTRDVYRALAAGGATTAAHALHDAVRALRGTGASPLKWAPYVHVGA